MKTVGKIAALALTLSLAFVLTACGGSSSSSAASSSASASAASSSASASSASAQSASASASASSASTQTSSAASAGDTYTNEFFGIEFDLPAGWSFVSASDIKNFNDIISAITKTAELDMVATNAAGNQMVIVTLEAPTAANASKTAEQYLEVLAEGTKADLGGNYAYTSTSATITFQGLNRELPAVITNLDINGTKISMCEAVAEKDGYFFNAIAIGSTEDEVTKAFENFSAISA